jgi:hypothetical protein
MPSGGHRGGINERWFCSATGAANGPLTTEYEGLLRAAHVPVRSAIGCRNASSSPPGTQDGFELTGEKFENLISGEALMNLKPR